MQDLIPVLQMAVELRRKQEWTRHSYCPIAVVVSHAIDISNGYEDPSWPLRWAEEVESNTGEREFEVRERTPSLILPEAPRAWVDINDALYSGKNYARTYLSDVVAYIWTVAPIVFTQNRYINAVKSEMDELKVITVGVSDFENPQLTVDAEEFSRLFPEVAHGLEPEDVHGITLYDYIASTI